MTRFGTLLILLLLIVQPIRMFSQDHTATGRIIDSVSGVPVPNATIYINGTSNGTISGQAGRFSLSGLELPCNMIISHLGYKLINHPLMDATGLENLSFSLVPEIFELEGATVIDDEWRKRQLEEFNRWFLGPEYEKLDAAILNDSVLFFNVLEFGGLDVNTTGPLIVSLPKSGYKLSVDLEKFELRFKEELQGYHCSILGYYFFDPMEPKNRRQVKRIVRKRVSLYYNSGLHFCRSLYNNALAENGYKLLKSYRCAPPDTTETTETVTTPDINMTHSEDFYGNPLLLLTDFGCREYAVEFKHIGLNIPVNLRQKVPSYVKTQRSRLIFQGDTVRILPSGRVPENTILFGGSIGQKGVASLLPEDYIPSMQ